MIEIKRITIINRLSILLFAVMFVLFGYQTYKIAFINKWADFAIYIEAAKQFIAGNNPYIVTVHGDYIYPLTLTWILIPLTLLPPILSQFVWYGLSVTCLAFSLILMMKLLKVAKDKYIYISAITSILFISIIQDDLMHSNINSIILFLCVFSVYKINDRKNVIGILSLALAISIKIMPIVLLLWIFLISIYNVNFKKQNLLQPIYLLLFVILFSLVIPYLFNGHQIFEWYSYYFNEFINKQLVQQGISKYHLTLAEGISILFTQNTYPPLILKLICGSVLCIFPIILYLKTKNILSTFIQCLVIMLLVDTNAEQHHLLFLIPGFLFLINYIIKLKDGNSRKKVIILKLFYSLTIPIIMLMILWGNQISHIPIEMFGLFILFVLIFILSLERVNSSDDWQSSDE